MNGVLAWKEVWYRVNTIAVGYSGRNHCRILVCRSHTYAGNNCATLIRDGSCNGRSIGLRGEATRKNKSYKAGKQESESGRFFHDHLLGLAGELDSAVITDCGPIVRMSAVSRSASTAFPAWLTSYRAVSPRPYSHHRRGKYTFTCAVRKYSSHSVNVKTVALGFIHRSLDCTTGGPHFQIILGWLLGKPFFQNGFVRIL